MSFDWQSHCDDEADGYTGTLNRNCVTIAEALRAGGYRTYISGKWHVTSELANKETWPTARGFASWSADVWAATQGWPKN